MLRIFFICALLMMHIGCGSAATELHASIATQTLPFVASVIPATASAGDTITIGGFGFSAHPEANLLVIGETITNASSYEANASASDGNIESLTFTVPAGLTAGEHPITLQVFTNTSNIDVSLTIL